jgi:hypothetical protein
VPNVSLTNLVRNDPEARTTLDTIMPVGRLTFGRKLVLRPLVSTNERGIVGTAFDYLFRLEIQRRFPGTTDEGWVAEVAVERADKRTAKLWKGLIHDARAAVKDFISRASPSRDDIATVARHAMILGRMDHLHRAGILFEGSIEEVTPLAIEDCVCLLGAVPWDELRLQVPLCLNPTFGVSSEAVGGADADIISCGRLIDIKSGVKVKLKDDLRQLVGYLILARAEGMELVELVLLYVRYTAVLVWPTAAFTEHAAFVETCDRFMKRAQVCVGR